LDEHHVNTSLLRPGPEHRTAHFGAIVAADDLWFATPFDDLIQTTNNTI